ncbi:MAG: helix-turn-helix transcriptional regulator [Cyclobacteriaceae bacterium]|nr:helix-turn-helix transcriptional regulator [Cyclobacteriaceae bacterium]
MKDKIHHGRNVKRFREMRGLKQEGLAYELGEMWNQKRVSLLEQKEVLDPDLIGRIAEILSVPMEAITNFNEDIAIQVLGKTKESGSWNNLNPLEEIFRLQKDVIALYERLINEKEEMIIVLEKIALR